MALFEHNNHQHLRLHRCRRRLKNQLQQLWILISIFFLSSTIVDCMERNQEMIDVSSSQQQSISSHSSSSSSIPLSSRSAKTLSSSSFVSTISPPPPTPQSSTIATSNSQRSLLDNDQWKNVLKKMTETNPCGSSENYTICAQCGQWTSNEEAFYMCCLNLEGVREYCISFINYELNENQQQQQPQQSQSSS
ncbi:hypothetical protein SSS_05309 [Sarcoptes scabiei]|uniref:Uncharacterized protein n=1 Tax=Sarcoptes scabiei TaxID=52283 RepID=A0A834R3U3_SARSC|nr:hypothetical protein SSS_05309 [Sarcoptes scabiei]